VKSKHPQKTEDTNDHLCTPQFEKPSNSPPPYFSTPYPFDAYVRESLSDDTLFDGPDFYTAESMFTTSQGCTNNIDPNYEQMGNFIDASLPNPFYELQGIAPPKRSGGRRTGIQSSHEDVVWQTATTALSQNNVAETSHYDEATWSDYLH
jgi:hypothetical protein